MDIKIERSQNDKLTRLYLGNIVIWFSYETPVAYAVPGIAGVVTSDKGWTQTTRRHIGSIPGRRTPIAHEDFERGLEQIQRAVDSTFHVAGMATAMGTTEERAAEILGNIAELVEQADVARGERIAQISQNIGTSPWSA